MRGQIRGLDIAQKNVHDGISLIQTAEGELTEVHASLQRSGELAVQAAKDTNVEFDRQELQIEIKEINCIGTNTEFNTIKLLSTDNTIPVPIPPPPITGGGGPITGGTGTNGVDPTANRTQRIFTLALMQSMMRGLSPMDQVLCQEIRNLTNYDWSQLPSSGATTPPFEAITASLPVLMSNSTAIDLRSGHQLTFHIGANEGQNGKFDIVNISDKKIGIDDVTVETQEEADEAITKFDTAINSLGNTTENLSSLNLKFVIQI